MKQRYVKLSTYAKENCITYRTAYRHWDEGKLKGKKTHTGSILIEINSEDIKEPLVATYARVSSSENKNNLEKQSERLRDYASAKGYKISKEIKEIGSGLNDNRKKLETLIMDDDIKVIIVEHKDRFCRFGMNLIQKLLEKQGRRVEIINEVNDSKDDLMQDFVSIITSFCARLYGSRRKNRKTEKIIKELNND